MTADEKNALEFIVAKVREHQAANKDELNTPSFDDAYLTGPNKTEPDFKRGLELALAYCSFYEKPEIREVRRLAQYYVTLCELNPNIASILSEAHKPEFVVNIRQSLVGLMYKTETTDNNGNAITIYTTGDGVKVDNYKPSMWEIVIDEEKGKDIDTFYRLFNDQYLWVRMDRGCIQSNARTLLGPLTAHIQMFELALQINAQFPFAQKVNDEKAIVVGMECDFVNDDIKLILAEPGGKLSYISSKNLNDITMVGEDRITKEPIDAETVAQDFGIPVDAIPAMTASVKTEEEPPVDIPTTTEGQYKGFDSPSAPVQSDSGTVYDENYVVPHTVERPPHENFGTLSGDMLSDMPFGEFSSFDDVANTNGFDANTDNYGDLFKSDPLSQSYKFSGNDEDDELNGDDDDEDEDFDDEDEDFDDEDEE